MKKVHDQTKKKLDHPEKKGEEHDKKVDKKGKKGDHHEKKVPQNVKKVEEPVKQEDHKVKKTHTQEKSSSSHHRLSRRESAPPLPEVDSVCDWIPPPEVPIVESESLHIPSRIPSIESFLLQELERERAEQLEGEEIGESEGERVSDEEEEIEQSDERISYDDDAADLEEEKIVSEDDLLETMQFVERKSQDKPKATIVDQFELSTLQGELDKAKDREKTEAEERLTLYLRDSTENFITKLIDNVVETCEYEDPDEILRARMDKKELLKELQNKLYDLDSEQHMRLMLNRKVVDFFFRKKALRPLTDDSPEIVLNLIRKYRDNLAVVNYYKGLEQDTKNTIEASLKELNQQMKELEEIAEEKTNEFFQAIKDALGAEYSDRMQQLAEVSMRRVRHMQKEISNVRFILIQRQHTLAVLQEKYRNLEELGNGLKMSDYEALQTDSQALGKKIEERNSELNRLHQHRNNDLQNIAHFREKQDMMRSTIAVQEDYMEDMIEEKRNCREYLHDLKLHRGAVRNEFKRISFASGLLDKPVLLLDYDADQEKIRVLKEKVASVKAEQLALDERMNEMKKNIRLSFVHIMSPKHHRKKFHIPGLTLKEWDYKIF